MKADILLHPQFHRVLAVDRRLRVAETLIHNPETREMGRDMVHAIRHDIIREKPHRIPHPFTLQTYFKPALVAAEWRADMNDKLALITALSIVSKSKTLPERPP